MNPAPILATRFILFNQVALIRREAFDRVGGYKPELRLLEDYDLACHLSLLGPWAFISDTLVEKYNDTKGIGVMAMRDPQAHSHAWQAVLAKFLKPATDHDPGVGMLVRRALTDVKSEIQAVNMLRGNDVLGRIMAQALIFCRQKRQSLRRRLPGWPRVLPLGVLPYDSGAGRSVVDYTEQRIQ